MMQFVVRNVAKVELDSTSATVTCHVAKKIAPCFRAFILYCVPSLKALD